MSCHWTIECVDFFSGAVIYRAERPTRACAVAAMQLASVTGVWTLIHRDGWRQRL